MNVHVRNQNHFEADTRLSRLSRGAQQCCLRTDGLSGSALLLDHSAATATRALQQLSVFAFKVSNSVILCSCCYM